MERPRLADRLFLKMQSGYFIFYLYSDWHPQKIASRLIRQSPPRGESTFVAEERHRGNPIGRSALSETSQAGVWRQQRKVT